MLKVPSHLSKTRNGIYYFRLVIPKNLREQLNYKREFTRTLQTENKHVAVKRARAMMVEMDKLFAQLKAKETGENPSQGWIQAKIYYPDGTKKAEIEIEQETDELEVETLNKFMSQQDSQQSSNFPDTLLSEVIEKYCAEQESIKDNWIEKTANGNRSIFALFVRVVGDKVFSELKYEQLLDFKTKFLKLPANINKSPLYRDKIIEEILQMPNVTPLARNTQNRKLNCISSLFKWSVINGFTDNNYASGLPIGKDKNPQDKVDPFTDVELKKLFESPEYRNRTFTRNYYYWVPLIALYTGARLNEICQLHLENIRQSNDLYVFNFDESEEDQRVKNSSSIRVVPIHSKLIDLGFITYFNELKLKKETRLFPDIKRSKNNYGDGVSKWYSRYMRKQYAKEGRNKVFHSFRHTVIDHLRQKKVEKAFIQGIVGHADGSVTFDVYGNSYKPEVLQEYIEMLEFDIKHTKFYKV